MMATRLFSYVITHDTGFAPNPFGGVLTLATCKPKIRASAQPGDWLLGTGSAKAVGNGKVVYAGQITEILGIAKYGVDPRFKHKRPSVGKEHWKILGDNIYAPDADGVLTQRRNPFHSNQDITRDLSGLNVLVCDRFWYFGASAPDLPSALLECVKRGPGHRCVTSPDLLAGFLDWLLQHPRGITGAPFRNRHLVKWELPCQR